MKNQYTLYDFLRGVDEEKIAGFDRAARLANNVGGKALKALNPISTAVGTVSSAKNSAMQIAVNQNKMDSEMGVSGRFRKVAADKDETEDKRYARLYKEKKRGWTKNQRAAAASGITLAALAGYGSIKNKDPLYLPKTINRNKGFLAGRTIGALIKQSPFKDVANQANQAIHHHYGTQPHVDLEPGDKLDKIMNGAAGNRSIQSHMARALGTSLAIAAGKKAGDALVEDLSERVKAKKLAREKEEQEWHDAYSKNLKAADLFKKASIATGDDIVTAVNKSVEKFLPEEIKKREERRNRYNSTVDYVDHGAHGGDAPQRRNK